MAKFTVGQKVFCVPSHSRGQPYEATITKIGRKWVYIGEGWGNQRFDPKSMHVDGGQYTSPASVWLSRSEWEEECRLNELWKDLRRALSNYTRPNHITAEDMATLAAILRVPPPEVYG